MTLYMSLCRALRNRSFRNAHILNGAQSEHASRSSYPSIDASSHRGCGFRAAVPLGSRHLAWPQSCECALSPHPSGFRAMHLIASKNYRQLGYNRDNSTDIKDCRSLAVGGLQRRFYSGFYTGGPALWTLITANMTVYLMWSRLPPHFMYKHFMVSFESLYDRRFHTLVTAAFSHFQLDHLLWNMMALFFFGGTLEQMFGGTYLFVLYLTGGICGSSGHVFYHTIIYPWIKKIPLLTYNFLRTPNALGASGAVTALTMLFILLYPTRTIFLMFIPVPAALAGCIIIGRDVYLAIRGEGTSSVGSHLGGALCGFSFYLAKLL